MGDDGVGLHVDAAGDHRHAAVVDAHALAHDGKAGLLVKEGHLTGRAQEEEAVDSGVDHAVEMALEGLVVDGAVVELGNDDGRDDAADLEV